METLTIFDLSLKFMKENQRNHPPFIYCVVKWTDQIYCSKSYEVIAKDWIQIINSRFPLFIELPKNHVLFKIQLWNYDSQQKLSETNITINDLTQTQKLKQFSINDRKIHLRFNYERKNRIQQIRDSQTSTLRVSYNKSDPNLLKLVNKPSSAYTKKANTPNQQIQIPPKYDSNYYGKWKFVPVRNQLANPKLKL